MINKSYATFSKSVFAENNAPDRGHLTAQSWVITISVNQGKLYSMLLHKHFHMRARTSSLSDIHCYITYKTITWGESDTTITYNCFFKKKKKNIGKQIKLSSNAFIRCRHGLRNHTCQALNASEKWLWQKKKKKKHNDFCKHILLWIHMSCKSFFFKEIKPFIQQGDMKLNKSDNINFYIITKTSILNKCSFEQ